MLLIDAPQAAVEPAMPEPEPLPSPDEPVIDDTKHDKEVIEHQNHDNTSDEGAEDGQVEDMQEEGETQSQAVDEHPNAVVPTGHSTENLPPAKTDPIVPTQIEEPEAEGTNLWQIVGLAAIGIIVLLVGVYSIIKCRKKCSGNQ